MNWKQVATVTALTVVSGVVTALAVQYITGHFAEKPSEIPDIKVLKSAPAKLPTEKLPETTPKVPDTPKYGTIMMI